MGGFLLRRAVNYAVLLLFASFIAFSLAALNFDPLESLMSRNPRPPAAVIAQKTAELHLDDPIPARYVRWVSGVARGDFGTTIAGSPVSDELSRRVGSSLRLLLLGSVLGAAIGVLVGAAGAIRQYQFSDYVTTAAALLLISTPVFLLANLLKLGAIHFNHALGLQFFAFTGEISASSFTSSWAALLDRAQHLVIPTLALALGSIASYSRYQRNAMLDVLSQDFIRTARAKGLRRNTAMRRHGLRTALIPMATMFAYGFGGVVTGAVFVEKIFGWHGIGEWFLIGIGSQDINIVAAVTVFVGLVILLCGLLSDLLYAALDPRVRAG